MNLALPCVFAAAALAMIGALFGITCARLVWADDLRHATELRKIWNRTEASMKDTIEIQERELKMLRERWRNEPPR